MAAAGRRPRGEPLRAPRRDRPVRAGPRAPPRPVGGGRAVAFGRPGPRPPVRRGGAVAGDAARHRAVHGSGAARRALRGAVREGRFQEGLDIAIQALALEEGISDPNVRAELREASVTLFTLCGRLDDARRLIAEYDEASERLSPHHRMHGVAMAIELHEITGDW